MNKETGEVKTRSILVGLPINDRNGYLSLMVPERLLIVSQLVRSPGILP